MSEFKNAVLHSVLLVCFASGCSSSDGVGVVAGVDTMPASDMADASSDTDVSQAVPWEPGEYAASHVTVEYYDTGRDRSLTVEVWFPGTEPPASPEPTETFEAETTARRGSRIIGGAPIGCPTRFTKGVRGGEYLDGLVLVPSPYLVIA